MRDTFEETSAKLAWQDNLSQVQQDVNEVREKVNEYVSQVENILALEVGDLNTNIKGVSEKVSKITSEFRDALSGDDESVQKVTLETTERGQQHMGRVRKNLTTKLLRVETAVTEGTQRLVNLEGVLREQTRASQVLEQMLNEVIRVVNSLPRGFPSLDEVIKVVRDLQNVVGEREAGMNLEVDTSKLESVAESMSDRLSQLERVMVDSHSESEMTDSISRLEMQIQRLKQLSIPSEKEEEGTFVKLTVYANH